MVRIKVSAYLGQTQYCWFGSINKFCNYGIAVFIDLEPLLRLQD